MSEPVAGIQPAVLRWARESQGYSLEDVARQLKRTVAEVAAWETGGSAPSYPQLETLAYGLYKRPLAVFFLPEPPSEPTVKQEFRTLPDADLENLDADTRYLLRLAHVYQLSLVELNDGANPAERLIFRDLRLSHSSSPTQAASAVRNYLGVSMQTQVSWPSTEEALRVWRGLVEDVGIFVFKHSFKERTISGFSLADEQFPLIFLNNSAAKGRQIFSLFHELAHVLLHASSISKFDDRSVTSLPDEQRRIEQLCNAFAADVLVPPSDFDVQLRTVGSVDDAAIDELAGRYLVSRETILRRLRDRSLVTQRFYDEKVAQWADESDVRGSGGNYYATQSAYLGERYLQLVFKQHYQGKITLEQAADYLGVKTKSIPGLEAMMLKRAV